MGRNNDYKNGTVDGSGGLAVVPSTRGACRLAWDKDAVLAAPDPPRKRSTTLAVYIKFGSLCGYPESVTLSVTRCCFCAVFFAPSIYFHKTMPKWSDVFENQHRGTSLRACGIHYRYARDGAGGCEEIWNQQEYRT